MSPMQNAWGKFWGTWCTFWSTCGRKFLYLARKYLNIFVFASNQFAIRVKNRYLDFRFQSKSKKVPRDIWNAIAEKIMAGMGKMGRNQCVEGWTFSAVILHPLQVSMKRKRKRSDSVVWQTPLHPQTNPKRYVTTQKRHQKLRLHNDCGPT